ncbi:hypothetical protein F4818DRAFT_452363 [Hypoxylon cercidicola]|nr:hypothetical protein F4818DRAFT_452363 [Hypoxylon cercidicola]
MKKSLSLLVFPGLLKAENYTYQTWGIIGGSIPPYVDTYTSQLITNAQQHPNATRSIQFSPFGAQSNLNSIPVPKDAQWTWRECLAINVLRVHMGCNTERDLGINVSDFSTPNAKGFDPARDPHVVTSTYDFNWPGGGNFSAALGMPNAGICVTVVDSPTDMPVNVTNAYTEDDTNSGSCVGTLGQACVDAILSEGRRASVSQGICTAPAESWFQLPECQSTLGYAGITHRSSGLATRGLGFLSSNATVAAHDGEAWYGWFSAPQYGSGSVDYYASVNRLHIAMVNPVFPIDEWLGGFSQGPELLCMRVNATKLPTRDPNGDGVTWTSEAVLESDEESIGSLVKLDRAWVLFTMTLFSLAFIIKS